MKAFLTSALILLLTSNALASTAADCIKMADESRAEMLRYKGGESSEANVKKSTKDAAACLDSVDPKGKTALKEEAIAAWKDFSKMREEKILPTVVRYNLVTKANKVNLDKTKEELRAIGESAADCIKKADAARAALLAYKDGKGDEAVVNQSAKDTSACIDSIPTKGGETQHKADAMTAWQTFRANREGKIIPDVKYFIEQSRQNTTNLLRTKKALQSLI